MEFFMEELGKVLKRKDTGLLMLLSLWPILFSAVIRINPSIMNYEGKLSALGFIICSFSYKAVSLYRLSS